MKNKKCVFACRASISTMLIPGLILATDIRPRNTGGGKINFANGDNDSIIVNINAPQTNGTSHNVYDQFDVNGKVILNNSTSAGQSILGGFIGKNPNFDQRSADLIITEVRSQGASNIYGAMEVFGKSANLIFANENGFNVGDVVFFNTRGVTFAGGTIDDMRVYVGERSNISISGNIQTDGSYFNVIAKHINIDGSVLTLTGKPLEAINFIAGSNEANLQNPHNPSVKKHNGVSGGQSGISGSLLGAMNGKSVKFITTGRGVGVNHRGAIFTLGDIMISSEGDVNVHSIKTAQSKQSGDRGSIAIDAENITTGILSGGDVRITARSGIRNEGIVDVASLTVRSWSYRNTLNGSALKLEGIESFGGVATINADSANFNVTQLENDGKINARRMDVRTGVLRNRHEILGEDINIFLTQNGFDNRGGLIAASRDLTIGTNQIGSALTLEDGRLYGGRMARVTSPGVVKVKGRVESPGSITFQSSALVNEGLFATKGRINVELSGLGRLRNEGYIYGEAGIIVGRSSEIINNGGMHSRGDISLSSRNIINNGGIWGRNIYLEADKILNSAQLKGSVSKRVSQALTGRGGVNYGDTAWKVWRSDLGVFGIPSFTNNLNSENSLIQASGNININTKSGRGTLVNNGWILAGGNVNTQGNVQNVTLVQEKRVEDILKTILSDGIINREYLGRWKTKEVSYLKHNSNLLDMLNFMADKRNKQHQRESAWNALKDLASKNSELNSLLSQYLGADYKSKRLIPDKGTWRTNAKIVFAPNNGAKISGRQNVNIAGNGFRQGISTELNNSIALMESKFSSSNQSKANLRESLGKINKGGLFSETNSTQDGVRRKFTSASSFIDQSGLYGIGYFINQSGRRLGSNVAGIGDNYYEHLYLSSQYAGIFGGLDKDKIKELLDNGAKYARDNRGVRIGDPLGEQQVKNLGKDMVWYVDIGGKNGESILAPVIYLTQETASKTNFSPVISGGNVNIHVNELSSSFGKIEGLDQVVLKVAEKLGVNGSQISGGSVNIGAGEVQIESITGHANGSRETIGQSVVVGAEDVNIYSNGNLVVKNGIVQGVSGNSSVKLIAVGGDVYVINDYSETSDYQRITDGSNGVISSSASTGVLGSSISGGNVAIGSGGNINITGSNVKGNGSVSITGGNVNIQGASNTTQQQYTAISTGIQSNGLGYVQYQEGESTVTTYNGSNVTSEGNLQIHAKGSLNVVGSNLSGQEAIDLVSQYLTVMGGYSTVNSSQQGSKLSFLNYGEQSKHEEGRIVVGSNLGGGDITIQTKDGTIAGSTISGNGNVDITADNLNINAMKNETKTTTTELNLGLIGGASVNLAGHGVEVSLENGQTNTKVLNGFDNSITSGGIRSEVIGSAKIGVQVVVEKEQTTSVQHTSSNLSGKNININVKGTTDVGGGNLNAKDDINVVSGEVANTQYVDSIDMSSMKWSVYVQDKVEMTSQLAAVINQQADQITALTNGENPNYALSAAGAVSGFYNVLTSPLAGTTNYIGGGVSVSTSEEHKRNEKGNNIGAGGNVTIATNKGDVNLSGTNLNGRDVTIDSSGNIIGRGIESSSNSKQTSVALEGNFETNGSVSVRDGGSVTLGADGVLVANSSNSNSKTYVNSSWGATGNLKLRSRGDVVLVGVNAEGQTVTLKIDGNLDTQNLIDQHNSSSFSGMAIGVVGVGASTQHVVTGNATGIADFGYKHQSSSDIANQTSIKGENLHGHIGGNLGLKATIISASGGSRNLSIAGVVLDESVLTYDKKDGARARLVVTTEGAIGGAVDIDDHLDSATKVNSVLSGITINDQKTNVNGDFDNTRETLKNESWNGGSINVTPGSKQKLKKLRDRFEGK